MLFLFVGSSFCTPASFGRSLAIPPLPSANTFVNVQQLLTLTGFTYRGLAPHKFTPMPGVHKRVKRTAKRPPPLTLNVRALRNLIFALPKGIKQDIMTDNNPYDRSENAPTKSA
jgi:hypothetical protein